MPPARRKNVPTLTPYGPFLSSLSSTTRSHRRHMAFTPYAEREITSWRPSVVGDGHTVAQHRRYRHGEIACLLISWAPQATIDTSHVQGVRREGYDHEGRGGKPCSFLRISHVKTSHNSASSRPSQPVPLHPPLPRSLRGVMYSYNSRREKRRCYRRHRWRELGARKIQPPEPTLQPIAQRQLRRQKIITTEKAGGNNPSPARISSPLRGRLSTESTLRRPPRLSPAS